MGRRRSWRSKKYFKMCSRWTFWCRILTSATALRDRKRAPSVSQPSTSPKNLRLDVPDLKAARSTATAGTSSTRSCRKSNRRSGQSAPDADLRGKYLFNLVDCGANSLPAVSNLINSLRLWFTTLDLLWLKVWSHYDSRVVINDCRVFIRLSSEWYEKNWKHLEKLGMLNHW